MAATRDEHGRFINTKNSSSPSKPPSNTSSTSKPRSLSGKIPKLSFNLTTLIVLVTLIVIAGLVSAYFYQQYQESQAELEKIKTDPNSILREENRKLVEAVGNIVELPKGEDPTIATVTDESRLSDQPFFAKAKKGDKVFIYTQAKRAYLYRPSTNKIIEIAPVNIGEEGESKTTQTQP